MPTGSMANQASEELEDGQPTMLRLRLPHRVRDWHTIVEQVLLSQDGSTRTPWTSSQPSPPQGSSQHSWR